MKQVLVVFSLFIFHFAFSQTKEFQYYNPASDAAFVIEGQAWPDEVNGFYDRLPARAEKKCSQAGLVPFQKQCGIAVAI